jgi:hypothetical protein
MDPDQTARMSRLVWIHAGLKPIMLVFVMMRLIYTLNFYSAEAVSVKPVLPVSSWMCSFTWLSIGGCLEIFTLISSKLLIDCLNKFNGGFAHIQKCHKVLLHTRPKIFFLKSQLNMTAS